MDSKRLLVMAGGTGGHLFPGLAVAHYLSAQGWVVRWLGTADRMEADLVPQQGVEIDFINISGLRGRGLKVLLTSPRSIYSAVCQARSVIERFQPQVVLGMGGYVSGPGGIAAWLANIPIVVHEQNAVFGLTNRCLSYFARRVLTAFPSPMVRAEVVGNPVRQALLQLPPPQIRYRDRQGPLRILVMGGSQGARVLNQVLPSVAKCLGQRIAIWHQVGRGAQDEVVQAYRAVGLQRHQVTEFIDEIAQAYAWADIVVCRAGALTVSELATVGLPAIFIPFQHADRQQYLNAQVLQRLGAADLIDEALLTTERLTHHIMRYDRAALVQRAQRARSSAIIDATQRVAAVIEAVAVQ